MNTAARFFFVSLYVRAACGWPPHSRRATTAIQKLTNEKEWTGLGSSRNPNSPESLLPKIIIFDLDGCLWRPEMYELLYFSKAGAPFTQSEHDENILLTRIGEPVYLLGNVRDVMKELYSDPKWKKVQIGISSRTDEPTWARDLLQKFTVKYDGNSFTLNDVIQGPIQISSESKIEHFKRISAQTGVSFEDMLFFDNESGNCWDVANLGVTVAYCPNGVDTKTWNKALQAFPETSGKPVEAIEF